MGTWGHQELVCSSRPASALLLGVHTQHRSSHTPTHSRTITDMQFHACAHVVLHNHTQFHRHFWACPLVHTCLTHTHDLPSMLLGHCSRHAQGWSWCLPDLPPLFPAAHAAQSGLACPVPQWAGPHGQLQWKLLQENVLLGSPLPGQMLAAAL